MRLPLLPPNPPSAVKVAGIVMYHRDDKLYDEYSDGAKGRKTVAAGGL